MPGRPERNQVADISRNPWPSSPESAIVARRPPPVRAAGEALDAFAAQRGSSLSPEGKVRWLVQHYPAVTHAQVADIVGITRQAVSKYVATMERQIKVVKAKARTSPGWVHALHGRAFGEGLAMAAQSVIAFG
jgi:hypothetical protein